jgi:hypothetical protein
MRISIDCQARRAAATRTSAATISAATASARGSPAATRTSPTSTANDPPRSDAKCSALEAKAADWWRRAARSLTIAREASTAMTMPSTRKAHHVVRISGGVSDARRSTAREARTEAGPGDGRVSASYVSAIRCSIVPSDSISIRTTSPSFRNCGGSIAMPTPLGVPVRIRSPASSVQVSEMNSRR